MAESQTIVAQPPRYDEAASSTETESLLGHGDELPAYTPGKTAPPQPLAEEPARELHDFDVSLFGCCANTAAIKTTILSAIAPCVTYGSSIERADHLAIEGYGSWFSWPCAAFGFLQLSTAARLLGVGAEIAQRHAVRQQFGINGSIAGDVCAPICCTLCSRVQVARQIAVEEERVGQALQGLTDQPVATAPMTYPADVKHTV